MAQFNAEEVFEMAVRIEHNGAVFYRGAAERFTEEPLHELLLGLAKMEDQHERRFALLRDQWFGKWSGRTTAELRDQAHAEYDDLAAAYLHALVQNKIFALDADPADSLAGVETPAQLLQAAIVREKESIIFYVGMKEAVPADLGRDAIDKIIREEMSHVTLLTEQLARL
jgi:rubrerythrin